MARGMLAAAADDAGTDLETVAKQAGDALAPHLRGGARINGVIMESGRPFLLIGHTDCRETCAFEPPIGDEAVLKTAYDVEQWFAPMVLNASLKRRQDALIDQF